MECLFFLSFSSSILLACDVELAILMKLCIIICMCNFLMVATYVYVQLAMYEWMELAYVICTDGTCLWTCLWMPVKYMNLLMDLLCSCLVKYIYICHIYLLWKLLDLIKNRKKSQYAGSLPSATDGNGLFAVCRGRQRGHVASSCASWELTHLVNLPTV